MKKRIWLLPFFVLAGISSAATYNWKQAVDGSFTDPNCWAEGIAPGVNDDANFNVDGEYTVSFDTTVVNKAFHIRAGDVSFVLNGNAYQLTNNGLPTIGYYGNASLTVTGGVLHITPQHYVYLGSDTSTGALTIKGADTTCIIDPGNYGLRCYSNATLRITDGAVMRDSRFYATLGNIYVINGGLLSNDVVLKIGEVATSGLKGDAYLWVTNGGVVETCGKQFWAGFNAGNTMVTVAGTGSYIRASASYLGNGSNLTELIVTNGALFNGGNPVNFNHSGPTSAVVNCTVSGNGARMGRWDAANNVLLNPGAHMYVGEGAEIAIRALTVSTDASLMLDGKMQSDPSGECVVLVRSNGLLKGSGTLEDYSQKNLYFRNQGIISPGNNLGTMSVTGRLQTVTFDYNSQNSGKLLIELGGAQAGEYDCFSTGSSLAGKSLAFCGDCEVVCVNGFQPRWGDSFQIIKRGNLTASGAFYSLSLPPLRKPHEWVTDDLYVTGEIRVGGLKSFPGTQVIFK